MSLLWRNHVRISLAPERLVVGAYARGLRAGAARGREIAVQPAANAEEWRAAVDALPEALDAMKGCEVSVVLADQFARYALLPWNAALRNAEQWMALARHRFAVVHGAAAAGWEVRVTETAPQGPRLACAVDRELLAGLSAALPGTRLVSVQPFLVAAFNRIRSAVGNGSCWLVVEETGRLTVSYIQRGVWVAIRSRRSDGRWREALPQLLERESAFLALAEPCTRVIVCAQGAFDTGRYESFRTQAMDYGALALAPEPA